MIDLDTISYFLFMEEQEQTKLREALVFSAFVLDDPLRESDTDADQRQA